MRRQSFSDINLAPEAPSQSSADGQSLGAMPEWDLSDLYRRPDAPEIQRDLKAAAKEAARIKAAYQGRLAELAKDGGKLAERHQGLREARPISSASSVPIRGFTTS